MSKRKLDCLTKSTDFSRIGSPASIVDVDSDDTYRKMLALQLHLDDSNSLRLRLQDVKTEAECQQLCNDFLQIHTRCQRLVGKNKAYTINTSAKNIGESYLKLLKIQQAAGANVKTLKSTQEKAIKFLTSALDGQLEYSGTNNNCESLIAMLHQAGKPLLAVLQKEYVGTVSTRMEFADRLTLPRIEEEINKTLKLLENAAESPGKRCRYTELSRQLTDLLAEKEKMCKDQHMSAPIIAVDHGVNDQRTQEQIQEEDKDMERAAQDFRQRVAYIASM